MKSVDSRSSCRRLASLVAVILIAGCTAVEDGDVRPEAAESGLRQRDVLQAESGTVSSLAVDVRDVSAVGRSVRFRGRVTSRYDEVVEGVRYRLRLFSTDGERVLRTEYSEVDTEISPGATEGFEMELQSMYFATIPRFVIDAVPLHLGDREFPPPADWD